jgi:uncharacterized membrane protein
MTNFPPKTPDANNRVSTKLQNSWLLLLWLIIGLGLRLVNLTAKPPWTDEFSTLVFSLGNSFLSVPLNQAIPLDVLLQPLQPNPAAGAGDVVANLLTQSNHPPLYFVLTHWWLRLFPSQGGLVSLWGARSLAAFFGAASIGAIYGLSWLAFRSRLMSHLSAAMMAVSPYGIFLAQEARHYTLPILWVIASLACLVIATRHIHNRRSLPLWVALTWVVINALGIATHYFFALTVCTEGMVILAWWLRKRQGDTEQGAGSREQGGDFSPMPPANSPPAYKGWWRILAVAAGSLASGLVWLPVFLQNSYGEKLIDWIDTGDGGFVSWISPIFQAIAAWITMICLLPVESDKLPVIIASGLVMLIFFIWAIPILTRGLKIQLQQPETRLMTQMFALVVIAAIALFFIFTYFLAIDLTRGARYNFIYFPAVIVLVGASLAICWNSSSKTLLNEDEPTPKLRFDGKKAVGIIWLMGFLSAVTVVCNLGYQKYYRPDQFVNLIQQKSQVPVLIATTQKTHVQIGEMMGVGREFKLASQKVDKEDKGDKGENYPLPITNSPLPNPQFLLAHQDKDPKTSTAALQQTLKALPQPFDLWLVNFYAPVEVNNCVADTQSLPAVDGYDYKLYHCEQN